MNLKYLQSLMCSDELLKPVGVLLTPKEKALRIPPGQSSIDAVMDDIKSGGGSTVNRIMKSKKLSKGCITRVYRHIFNKGLIKRVRENSAYGAYIYYMLDDDTMPKPVSQANTDHVFNHIKLTKKCTKSDILLAIKISKYRLTIAIDVLLKDKKIKATNIGFCGGHALYNYECFN